jgi:hypothetical protein
MRSLKQRNASRINGARSKGPKTPGGKRRASLNAVRHGLLAQCTVIHGEPLENFEALLGHHLAKFGPVDGVEFGMIEEMASSYWRLRRAWTIEKEMFDQVLLKQSSSNGPAGLGAAYSELAENPKLHLLNRYQTALHRTYQRALFNLLLLRRTEPGNIVLPNEPDPISGQHLSPVLLAPDAEPR